MPLIKHNKLDPVWFTPDEYQGDEDPIEFKIKPLTGAQSVEVGTEIVEVAGVTRVTGKGLLLAVRHGLIGWRNYIDDRGKDIKFSIMEANNLPSDLLSEIAVRIYELSEPDENEKKQ